MFATGAAEPTTSIAACGGAWRPVRDPASPAQAMGVVSWGTPATVVALPKDGDPGAPKWLALRIVYEDETVNPTGPFDPRSRRRARRS